MTKENQDLGRWGEQTAAAFLIKAGYTILAQNVRTTYGEIDLIARQDLTLPQPQAIIVFVEVKTRRTRRFGLPEQAVAVKKQAHLCAAAAAYMQQHPELPQHWRIDVVAIQRRGVASPPEIGHFEDAVHSAAD
jgi:putative endonuclease